MARKRPLGPNWKLCVIVGKEEDPCKVAEAALSAGVRLVQYRGKEKASSVQLREAIALRERTNEYGAVLVINDRPDIALLCGADAVHLGETDLPLSVVRRIVGSEMILGATAHSLLEGMEAEEAGADYIGFGAVFATSSKAGATVVGPEALESMVRQTRLPVLAIGGIHVDNVSQVFRKGAAGVAVLSAVSGAADPAGVCRRIFSRMENEHP
jgi:thiamine-phosphate pyrophosphorylase